MMYDFSMHRGNNDGCEGRWTKNTTASSTIDTSNVSLNWQLSRGGLKSEVFLSSELPGKLFGKRSAGKRYL